MALPVAIVVYSDTPIAATSLPSSRTFSASTSTPGTGAASIVGYQWYLLDKPPGSTSSLLNDTSVTCTLQDIDLPGSYRLFCVVEDDEGALSAEEPQPVQSGSAPYSFSVPPTSAFAVVTALTRYAGLKKVAYGELQWLESGLWPVVDAVDILHRDVKNAGSGQPEGVVFITSGDGEVDANGSPARPFNPASAVAAGFTGPWQQAQAALLNLELVDRRPLTIVAMGGIYDEDVDITVEGVLYDEEALYELDAPQWCIFTAGLVSFDAARKFSFSVTTPAGDGIALAALTIAPYIGGLDTTGFVLANTDTNALGIGAAADAQAIVYLTNVTANVGVKTLLTSAGVTFRKCSGDVLLPSAGAIFDEHSAESVEVLAVRRADRSTLGDVTVSVSAGTGYYGCNIDSFTGPANSAKFDVHTAATFEALSGVFSGGASRTDYLKIGGWVESNGPMTIVSGQNMEMFATNGLTVETPYAPGAPSAAATIKTTGTNAGLLLATEGADAAIAVLAVDGDITVATSGAGKELELRAPVVDVVATTGEVKLRSTGNQVYALARVYNRVGGHVSGDGSFLRRVATIVDAWGGGTATPGLVAADLYTYDLPANALAEFGSTLKIQVTAGVVDDASSIEVYFGATKINEYVMVGGSSAPLTLNSIVTRTGPTSQVASGTKTDHLTTISNYQSTPTETLSGAVQIRVVGTSPSLAGNASVQQVLIEMWANETPPAGSLES